MLKSKVILILLFGTFLIGCKSETNPISRITAKNFDITDSLSTATEIDSFVKPYKNHINSDLDKVLAYSVDTYSKSDGELNTAIGNFMADLVFEQSNPVLNKRTGKNIDFVLLNHGGIRSIISKGNVTARTAYKIMPFENAIVVLDLNGEQVKELIDYLIRNKRAHPISGLEIEVDSNYNLSKAEVRGELIDFNKNYLVATNDYLANGGDHMNFFKTYNEIYTLDYKIRNALIDYLEKIDTLSPKRDKRFIKVD